MRTTLALIALVATASFALSACGDEDTRHDKAREANMTAAGQAAPGDKEAANLAPAEAPK